jgi:hypothetical protein
MPARSSRQSQPPEHDGLQPWEEVDCQVLSYVITYEDGTAEEFVVG